jgi:hypothetical protein
MSHRAGKKRYLCTVCEQMEMLRCNTKNSLLHARNSAPIRKVLCKRDIRCVTIMI